MYLSNGPLVILTDNTVYEAQVSFKKPREANP